MEHRKRSWLTRRDKVELFVRIFAFDICAANAAAFDPCFANRAERRKVVLAVFHECQFCDERDVYAETRQGFNEASQP